ncbi:MAG: hypothetical protein AB1Z67_08950 [Candidatus Limnocylindrales bacterium]
MKVKSRILLAVVAGTLAVSTAGVAAQEPESEVAFFDVTMTPSVEPTEPETVGSGPGWESWAGLVDADIAVDAGDPRASGLLDQVRSGADFGLPDGGLGIASSSVRLVNEQGIWVGEGAITTRNDQGPPTHLAALWRLEGEGAYEGLILEFHSQGDRTGNPSTVWGAIYPAEAIPELPDPIGS